MKYFLLACSLFFFGNVHYAQKAKQITDIKKDNLFGKIHTIQTMEYIAVQNGGMIEKGDKISSLFLKYNDTGYLLESSEYNSDGSLMQKEVFEYDKKNNRITELLYTESDKIDQRIEIKYNTLRLPIKQFTKDDKGRVFQKTTFLYDERNNLIQQSGYDERGKLAEKSYYTYDDKGNLILYTGYGEFDNRKISYKYDNDNRIIESMCVDIQGNFVEKITYQYENSPQSVRKTYLDKDNKPLKSELCMYDTYDNLLEIMLFNEHGAITEKYTFLYQYDEKQNWTILTTYMNSDKKAISITERVIEYY